MKSIKFNEEQVEFLEKLVNNTQANKKLKTSILIKLKNAKKPPIKISSRKSKGRNLQYWVCQKIASIFNLSFDQKNDSCEIHSREMGLPGKDIILRGEIAKKFPYDIECKNCEQVNLLAWVEQAKKNSAGNWLLVLYNSSFKEKIVVCSWETFEFTYKHHI